MRAGASSSGHPQFRLFCLAALVLPLIFVAVPAHASDAGEIPFNTAKILEFHNAERAARGVGPLARDPRMDQHAQQLAESLAVRGVLQHTPSYARTIGYPAGGQNLVYRGPSMNASQANYLWMVSDVHRKNLLNPGFSHAGIGIACSRASGRPYPVAVVDFGGTSLSPAAPPQDPITVPHDALQGHSLVCDGSSGAAPPAPQPPPPPPLAPVPVAAPAAPKPAAPKAAPALVAPAPAPPPEPAPVPPAEPEPMLVAAVPPGPAADERLNEEAALKQAAPISETGGQSVEGLLAFLVGCFGALVIAGVAGGVWSRQNPIALFTGKVDRKSGKNLFTRAGKPADK